MIYITPFLWAFLIGILIIWICEERNSPLDSTDFFAAIGLGVGLFSYLSFFSLFIFGKIILVGIWALSILILLAVFIGKSVRKCNFRCCCMAGGYEFLKVIVLFLPFFAYIFLLTIQRPYGDWDAWSLWSLHARSLLRSGIEWPTSALTIHHPWLLPLFLVWGWAVSGGETIVVSILTAMIFTFFTVGLLVSALLTCLENRFVACSSGILLFSSFFFVYHATSQYADVVVAYYFLGIVVYFLKACQRPSRKNIMVLSLFLGFLSFTKQEGIAIAVLFLFFFFLRFFRSQEYFSSPQKKFFFFLSFSAMLPTMFVVFVFPLAIHYQGVLGKALSVTYFYDIFRWSEIVKFSFLNAMLYPGWNFLWIIFIILFLLRIKFLVSKENVIITSTVFTFLLIIFLRFLLTTDDLVWHLSVAFNRILFELIPAVTFMMFYATFQGDDE